MSNTITNNKRSGGPRTPEGKKVSSGNAYKHGVYAKHTHLHEDDLPAFELLGTQLAAQYEPQTPGEIAIVDQIQQYEWRAQWTSRARGRILDDAALDQADLLVERYVERGIPLDERTLRDLAEARAYEAKSRVLADLRRDEAHLRRLIAQCEKSLALGRSERAKRAAEEAKKKPTRVVGRWIPPGCEPKIHAWHVENGTVLQYEAEVTKRNDEERERIRLEREKQLAGQRRN